MSNGMQLISLLLFLLSLMSLIGAVAFVAMWQRSCRKTTILCHLHESIAHIGVSAVVEYPETSAPLIALLEEEYPRSEAVLITDLQRSHVLFGELIGRYHLIRVNHTHLESVRALYRSRHRAFRRVVLVDLPTEHRDRASAVGAAVASYDYILHLRGESIVERNAIAYCANVVASQLQTDIISLQSIVGAPALLEKGVAKRSERVVHLRTDRALAWRDGRFAIAVLALLLPALMVALAYFVGSRLIFLSATVAMLAVGVFLYVSCRVVTEKGLFVRLDTILRNIYRLIVERAKKFHYLYKEGEYEGNGPKRGFSLLRLRLRRDNRNAL